MNPPRRILHLISQAHLDPVWLWPLQDGVAETLTTCQSAVDRLRETPSFRFTRSSAAAYRWVKDTDPRLYKKICEAVEAGRWEVVGGWVEQPDCNLPSAESFIRQALEGAAFLPGRGGEPARTTIGYNVDSFGHCGGLPQILQLSGMDAYAFMRPEPWDNPDLPLLFWWEGPDGSRVLACRIPGGYSQSYAATADDVEKALREADEKNFAPGFDVGVMWFGVGNHGGGPTREHIARVLALQSDPNGANLSPNGALSHSPGQASAPPWVLGEKGICPEGAASQTRVKLAPFQSDPGLPEIRFSTLREFLDAVRTSPSAASLPVVRGELGYVFRGCYAANGETKRLHRACEKALFAAESLEVTVRGAGAPSKTLREAWWELLNLQFHDILAGTCVATVQEEILHRFGSVLASVRQHSLRKAMILARRVNTRREKGGVLFAFNPLPWPRRALVQLDTFVRIHGRDEVVGLESPDGQPVAFQWLRPDANFGPWGLKWGKFAALVDLPAGGYKVFRVITRRIEETVGDSLAAADPANPQFSGKITTPEESIVPFSGPAVSSLPGIEGILAGPVGFSVAADTGGTWGHGKRAYNEILGHPESTGCEVLEDGPLVRVLREKFRWGRSEIWLDAIRITGAPTIELRIRFNWQEHRAQLKLEIPTGLETTTTRARMPAESAARPCDGSEFPCHDWVALEGTLGGNPAALVALNDATYSYSSAAGTLRFTLARGVPHAEHPPFDYKDTRNVTFLDQGWQERRFALAALPGTACDHPLDRMAEEFQIPPIALPDSAHAGNSPRHSTGHEVTPDSVNVLAIKPGQRSGAWIVRVRESAGRATSARISTRTHAIELPLAPFEIASIRLYPNGKWDRVDIFENLIPTAHIATVT